MKHILNICFGVFILLRSGVVLTYHNNDVHFKLDYPTRSVLPEDFKSNYLNVIKDDFVPKMVKGKWALIYKKRQLFKIDTNLVDDYRYADIFDPELERVSIEDYKPVEGKP